MGKRRGYMGKPKFTEKQASKLRGLLPLAQSGRGLEIALAEVSTWRTLSELGYVRLVEKESGLLWEVRATNEGRAALYRFDNS